MRQPFSFVHFIRIATHKGYNHSFKISIVDEIVQ
jgi:hypothetical protein